MARRHSRHSRKHFKIPLLTLAILGAQGALAYEGGGKNFVGMANVLTSFYTGIDIGQQKFVPFNLALGWGPWLVKGLVTKVARPMGAQPRIPFGLPVSIS